jgi:hypothetical protein
LNRRSPHNRDIIPELGIDIAVALLVESPAPGDVLISNESGRYFLSIVPYPHRLSLGEYNAALEIAKRWAETNNVSVWSRADGNVTKL